MKSNFIKLGRAYLLLHTVIGSDNDEKVWALFSQKWSMLLLSREVIKSVMVDFRREFTKAAMLVRRREVT